MHRAALRTIDQFAELTARLADPFVDRQLVLASAGLDDAGWRDAVAWWRGRLEGGGEAERLARRFCDEYARVRAAIAQHASSDVASKPARDARFLSTIAQPWRSEAAAVPLQAAGGDPPPLAQTVEAAHPVRPRGVEAPIGVQGQGRPAPGCDLTAEVVLRREPVLPFLRVDVATAVPAAPPAYAAADTNRAGFARTSSAGDATVELRAFTPTPVLPFDPSGAAARSAADGRASEPPRGRWMRFDPQTGTPLTEPRWVDLPSPAPGVTDCHPPRRRA